MLYSKYYRKFGKFWRYFIFVGRPSDENQKREKFLGINQMNKYPLINWRTRGH